MFCLLFTDKSVFFHHRFFFSCFKQSFVLSILFDSSGFKKFTRIFLLSFRRVLKILSHPWKNKNKKGKIRKKRKSFKAKTIKRLSSRSKYYCFSHSRAFTIQTFSLSVNHGGRQHFSVFNFSAFHFSVKSISLALYILLIVCKKYSR